MTLSDFTLPGLIVPALAGRDPASVIQELSLALQREGCLPDLLPFYQAALNREYMANTGMEDGIAIPHARLAGLNLLAFAFGRSAVPVQWGPQGSSQIRLVFLIAVPATEVAGHLQLISGLARLAKDVDLRERLLNAGSVAEMLRVFDRVPVRGQTKPNRLSEPRVADADARP
jgi:mannitol/fructose-specific phosphotransferase system IIA component (Ntr-type)